MAQRMTIVCPNCGELNTINIDIPDVKEEMETGDAISSEPLSRCLDCKSELRVTINIDWIESQNYAWSTVRWR